MRLLFLAALTASAFLRAAEPQVLDGIAAQVGEDVITFSQVRELTGALERQIRATPNIQAAEATAKIKEVRLRAVNDLIDRQLIVQEFRRMKATIPAHVVEDRITALIRDEFGGDRKVFQKTIADQGFTLDRIRKMEEEKVIVQAMRARQSKGDPMIPASRIESFYREHRQDWTTNEEVKLRMIKIAPATDPKKRTMMQEIREKLVRGADFGDLARIYSEDSTQDKGGDWGWVKRGDFNPELDKAVFEQSKGKVSGILTIDGNLYLLLIEDKKPGITKPLKELRDQIEKFLIQQERQKMQQGWLERLRKKTFIKIY